MELMEETDWQAINTERCEEEETGQKPKRDQYHLRLQPYWDMGSKGEFPSRLHGFTSRYQISGLVTSKIISPLIASGSDEVLLNQLACVVVRAYNVSCSTGLRLIESYRHGMESVCVQSFELEYPKCKKEVKRRLSTIPKHGCERLSIDSAASAWRVWKINHMSDLLLVQI